MKYAHLIILILLVKVFGAEISSSLLEKLQRYSGQVLSFNDQELKELLYKGYSDVFILFYYSKLISSRFLDAQLSETALKVYEEGFPVIFGTVDLITEHQGYYNLYLTQHPCGAYLTREYYYNYTGPFDSKNLYKYITEFQFLRSPPNLSPKPLTAAKVFDSLYYQVLRGDLPLITALGALGVIILIFIVAGFIAFCRKSPEIKDD
jgi:hypothetical protein